MSVFVLLPSVSQEMDQLLLTFGDIPHHGPVLLAWVLLRHTLRPDESNPMVRRIGSTALQLEVFKYLATMLKGLGVSGNNVMQCQPDQLWCYLCPLWIK